MVIRGLAATVAACLLLPGAAHASQAFMAGSQLVYVAGAGEPNSVSVKRVGATHEISDPGAVIAAGALCGPAGPGRVTCSDHPTLGVTLVVVVTGDLDDSARLESPFPASMNGGPGGDRLTGGAGGDTLNAGPGGDDRLSGGGGNDTLTATDAAGSVVLLGGDGDDSLTGLSNPDAAGSFDLTRLDGGAGADTLNGSLAQDILTGGDGPDRISGGAGTDAVRYDDRTQVLTITVGDNQANDGSALDGAASPRDNVLGDVELVYGGRAGDTITGSGNPDTLFGGAGFDKLSGGPGNDHLCGDGTVPSSPYPSDIVFPICNAGPAGADVLNGDGGNDTLQGGRGIDQHNGGAGRDMATWAERGTQRIVATIDDCTAPPACAAANDGQADAGPAPGAQPEGDTVSVDVENLAGAGGDDTLAGSGAANVLGGGGGSDELDGLGGDDTLCGDLVAFTGPCTFNSFTGPPGDDTLAGGAGNDVLDGEGAADVLEGGDGIDTVTYARHNRGVDATISDDCGGTACAQANDGARDTDFSAPGDQPEGDRIERDVENLAGGSSDDLLRGDGDPNVLAGGGGSDRLEGLVGRDVLEPGTGSGDVVAGGGSFDVVSYQSHDFFVSGGLSLSIDNVANDGSPGENDDIRTDVESIHGSDFRDVITGHPNAVADVLFGYDGADVIDGRGGADVIVGGHGSDTLLGGEGDDQLDSADEAADATVDCGDGTADVVQHDDGLDAPAGCETLDPFDAPAMARVRW